MKFKQFMQLSREEQESYQNKVLDLLGKENYLDLLGRMKFCIRDFVSENSVPEGFVEHLLKDDNYTVEFKAGKLDCIKLKYSYYDSITATVNMIGFMVDFKPEHGEGVRLFEVDGFEEFLELSDKLVQE